MQKSKELSKSLEVGKINQLEIYKKSQFGLFLRSGDGGEVLLPNAYVNKDLKINSLIEVFLYHDSEDRIVATTLRPKAMLDEYGLFEVVDYRQYGAFVDWGLPKDLFVPLSQQKEYFRVGQKKLLRVCRDDQTGRLYATQKLGKYFVRDMKGLKRNQEVDILILAKTPLGYKAIVDNRYEGMLFFNDTFEELECGDRRKGYITKVRTDKKLDLSLRPIGKDSKIQEAKEAILKRLEEDNKIALTYKSSPQQIQKHFPLSRKIFKQALTALLEEGSINLSDREISKS